MEIHTCASKARVQDMPEVNALEASRTMRARRTRLN
jgi:hypothetical protein